ncbi:subfamily B ATP-binding cassette protein HlyB/CyaB [Bradyrhizobium macuxiense]|uniref:Subfamily B ATP-binding cassette protein HlyB/CyaB n=1 Tax=Bradyrhizobium macuxiense TaxID=1755647 RepID=A0A560L391_9BRAD|nr:type I secretion system permease/ATPase [Bradyrhizobium macuxiense]TWB89933.1 subfamily B ATP-binding cassette protein HlyB/CyaB [Bradyrhizobium macuxiense]
MTAEAAPESRPTVHTADTGLDGLCLIARFLGVPANADDLRRRYAITTASRDDLVRIARRLGFKARPVITSLARIDKTPLPALAEAKDGTFFIMGKVSDGKLIVQLPTEPHPRILDRAELEATWSGRLIMIARRATASSLVGAFDLRWFISAVNRYRRVLGEVVLASFFIQVLGLLTPLFFQVVVDKVLVHRGLSTLDVLVVGLACVALFEVALGTVRTFVFSHTTNRIDIELGARLFDHLLALPIAYFATRRVGDSIARVRELENIRSFLTGSALTLTIDLFFTFVFFAVMFFYSVTLTWVVIASLPVYIAISAVVTPMFRRRLDEKFARGAENQAFLVEAVTGIDTLKAMAVEPHMQRRWEEQLAGYVHASFRTQNLANVGSQAVQFVNKATIVLTLYLGAKAVIAGELTVGELVAFNMLAARVAQPVLRIAQLWQDFQQTRISVARLGDILNTPREPAQNSAASLPPMKGAIRFDHATFRYRMDLPPVLSDIVLDIPAGQVVGIVGPSGSGKSTLAKLVQRFYAPEGGRILIDGIDLSVVDTAWLRRNIGIVLQESVLFNRTVRENIALADPGAPIERVMAVAALAGAHDFILELPNAYDTMIGERGASLSGGQRQRIAIARALMTNPRILVLDEATSALDYESERIVQENMRRISSGRTVLIIAHRLSAVRRADRIITLEQGRIVEDGTHDELIGSGGRYAHLVRIQAGVAHAV